MHTTLFHDEKNSPQLGPCAGIIVVNYNGAGLLQDCIDALAAQTLSNFEVIVFDNVSTDNSIIDLKIPDGRFRVLTGGANLGFSAANNVAAQLCNADWIATLNPDARPSPIWLAELIQATNRYPWAQA